MNCAVHTDTPAVAYCRTCGKALCENCKRDVMGAIYCEPCIAARLHGTQAPAPAVTPVAVTSGGPSPAIAMLLGFIPGVGAMYNSQFLKGFIHVVIFVMLIVAADNISGLFGLLIAFFVIYMAFDAYKTAEAIRMGLPLPDALGLDRIFGLHEHQARPSVSPAAAANVPGAVTPPPPPPAVRRSSEPVGAIVLIALGVIFLLGNLGWFHAGRFWPVILIGVGLWIAYKRTTSQA